MGFYFDLWIFGSPMELRTNNNIYNQLPYCLYPKKKFIPELKRGGFNGNFHKVSPFDYFTHLLSDNRCETLLKAGYTNLFSYFIYNSRRLSDYWPSIRIAIRNGYQIKDAGIWVDYLDNLRYFGKDLYSPRYVCSADLRREHDRYMKKRRRIIDREQQEVRRERNMENEKRYSEAKARFFGIEFTDGTILVRVIESVAELRIEGEKMHHCVGSYYDKVDSLILSATIDGKRIETVEVSLSKLSVIQCRGVCNKNTQYHNNIIDLVNRNIPAIQQRLAA
jgi:hypothetical protein